MLVAPTSAIASSTISLELLLGERLRHELLEHVELALLLVGLLVPAGRAEGLRRLARCFRSRWSTCSSSSSCSGRCSSFSAERRLARISRSASRRSASRSRHRLLQLVLDARDQAHPASPQTSAAEDVPVQVEDRLAGARARRSRSRGSRRGPRRAPSRRRSRASASPRPPGTRRRRGSVVDVPLRDARAGASSAFGRCRGSRRSRRAVATWSPSPDELAEEAVRQAARIPSSVTVGAADADELADAARRRATASSRRRSRGPAGRRARRPRRRASRASARRLASREPRAGARRAPSSPRLAPVSAAAVAVPGRGEYGKTCTFVIPAAPTTRERAARTPRSSSPGKPTITSVVRLKSPSGSSRRR